MRLFSRELQREKIWSRIHLVPLLLAEGDRDAYRRERAALAREKEIMNGVKDWEVRRCLACRILDWLTGSACCFSSLSLNFYRWARASIIIHVTGHPSGLWSCRWGRVRKQAIHSLVLLPLPVFLDREQHGRIFEYNIILN